MSNAKVKKKWSDVDVTGFDPYKDALQARLINLIWEDETLKQKMLSNPKALFEQETGILFPTSMEVKVLEESNDVFYFVVPSLPENEVKWEQFYQQMSVWWTLSYTWWYWMYRMNIPNSKAFREALETLIIVRFMQNDCLMKAFLTNPKAELEKYIGISFPSEVIVEPLLETANLSYFVLPQKPQVERRKLTELGKYWMEAHTWFWWLTSLRIKAATFEIVG